MRKIGVLMDPPERIRPAKDSTVAMLRAATRRGYEIVVCGPSALKLAPGDASALFQTLNVHAGNDPWFSAGERRMLRLDELDVLMLRKDPPVDTAFLHELLWASMVRGNKPLLVNHPQALRDCNEKLFALEFPQCCPPTLVARDAEHLRAFVGEHDRCVLKPIDGMAGRSIFRSQRGDPNLNVILETLTDNGRQFALAQRFIPEISAGDKRILMIDGEPVPFCLARIPGGDDFRGNLARGGRGVAQPLSERDRWICAQVGPELKRRGLLFVGLDVIGDWLTEINVTSPTGIVDIDAQTGTDIGALLFDAIESKLA
ncbi:MAG: glutathione synthase [Rhodanobacteraceae bacterium]|nr:glutathione synthase [Rhodanobacteraceae bacterium]